MEDLRYRDREHFQVLFLDTRNQVLGVHSVYRGSVNTSLVRSS